MHNTPLGPPGPFPSKANGPDLNAKYPCGVSVIICCHNSAGRLAATLDHLVKQRYDPGLPWEIIVVDNASSDCTAEVALSLWPDGHPRPLRIVREDKLGLSHARVKGLSQARYEYITFADDDNWLCPEWVQTVAETFQGHPEVGMLTGRGEAVFEATPPSWFRTNERSYAVGAPSGAAGVISPALIWGAGMCLRHSAWDALQCVGFKFILPDRRGLALTSGGDTELVLSVSFMGWKAWYEPRLYYKHWIPASRLTTGYLRRLHRAYGISLMALHMYGSAGTPPARTILGYARRTWLWRVLGNARALCRALLSYSILLGRGATLEDALLIEGTLWTVVALTLTGPKKYRQQQQWVTRLYEACRATANTRQG